MVLLVAYLSIFFDNVNISLVQPVIPALVEDLNSNTLQEGIYFSIYSVMMLISMKYQILILNVGTLIMGPLSDRFGRKPFLVLSLLGDLVGMSNALVFGFRWWIGGIGQALAPSMAWFIFWRGLAGLFAGSIVLIQA